MAKFRSCSLSVQQRHQPTTRRLVCITIGGWLPPLHLSEDGPLPTSANNDAQRRTETWLAQCRRRRSIFGKSYYPSTSPGDRTSPKFPWPPFGRDFNGLFHFGKPFIKLKQSPSARPVCWMLNVGDVRPLTAYQNGEAANEVVCSSLTVVGDMPLHTWRAVYLYSPKFFLFRQRSTAQIHPIFFDGIFALLSEMGRKCNLTCYVRLFPSSMSGINGWIWGGTLFRIVKHDLLLS